MERTKKFAKHPEEIQEILQWEGPEGCLATDRITVDGCRVGYMYREEPTHGTFPDSGWRFFEGQEPDEYVNNPDNVGAYRLNTICNYDRDVMSLLTAPFGTAYYRDENGVFQQEPLYPQAEQ